MGGWRTHPTSTRIFLSWKPGADVDQQTRLDVTKYVAGELDNFGGTDQHKYNELVQGIVTYEPGAHMYLEGVMERAREMAGGDFVHVWVGVTVIPGANRGVEYVNEGNTMLCAPLTFDDLVKTNAAAKEAGYDGKI